MVAATQRMLARLIGTGRNPAGAVKTGIAIRRAAAQGRLLIHVGSEREPSIRDLSAFLDTVFAPALAPEGYVLVVAGTAGNWVARTHPDMPGLVRAGILPDLRPILEARATLVLPVLGGTGFSVKTLEALVSGLPVVGTAAAFRGLDPAKSGVRVAELADMAQAIRAVSADRFTRRSSPPAFGFAAYCRTWAGFLSEQLDRPLDLPADLISPAAAPLSIAAAVTEALAPPPVPLQPIPRGRHEVSPAALPVLTGGSFGFYPKASETHWMWSASWYFGFLLDPAARGDTLRLSLTKIRLPDWITEVDMDVFVDGLYHRIRFGRDAQAVDIPLFKTGAAPDEPVLVEILLPDAKRMPPAPGADDTRVLALCLAGIEIADIRAPLMIRYSEFRGMTDRDFITFAFERVLGKVADKDGLDHYATLLSAGTGRRQVIETLARDPDCKHPQGVVVG
jgi:hypothetical protein